MGSPGISRRRLLGLGGAAAAASLAACAAGTTSDPAGAVSMSTGSFTLQFRPETATGWSLAVPESAGSSGAPGAAASGNSPVAVFLHGTGAGHRMIFEDLRAADVLSQHISGGATPFAIAAVDGGESWWHRRASGTDTQAMVVEEFIPLLAEQGLDTGRLAVFGLSMGGFGALLLA
ncbi:alpha/beta hydrolase-fold protein [Arthrobacter oryzae]|uniref:alpha/beta hydrolase-fold protein n=1 Tax=Arthrobacter oryzae TaxID=409290 RepID=UPI002861C8D7|nr:alpha/beta hydrolase-fold protein [Arthrobacter oryzae]MDR6508822.1 S-formylglutathione hydrolase FrmB [Arthrobacter oryzae]